MTKLVRILLSADCKLDKKNKKACFITYFLSTYFGDIEKCSTFAPCFSWY